MPKTLVASLILLAAAAQYAHAAPAQEDTDRLLEHKGLASRLSDSIHQATDRAGDVIRNAMGALGVPYRRGGTSAETGFDCSGFVRSMYQQTVGLMLPRTAAEQAATTASIDKTDLRPGDLVFFNTLRRAYSHVGIYLGEGKFIHSPRAGSQVRVESMNIGYWQSRFNGARRVLASTPAAEAPAATALPRLTERQG
ncbi:MAG: C40 family peptidase, partial [Burkholderiales bacterium]|nr:C40 family peptidase [Burkholderiales bacterium]